MRTFLGAPKSRPLIQPDRGRKKRCRAQEYSDKTLARSPPFYLVQQSGSNSRSASPRQDRHASDVSRVSLFYSRNRSHDLAIAKSHPNRSFPHAESDLRCSGRRCRKAAIRVERSVLHERLVENSGNGRAVINPGGLNLNLRCASHAPRPLRFKLHLASGLMHSTKGSRVDSESLFIIKPHSALFSDEPAPARALLCRT
jgi:hypothetical protein